ncbi:MAG: integron integrase [Deltaproteobacteria bacterium]|nr:integron integrase [Deltaproteobacteria bacterium]
MKFKPNPEYSLMDQVREVLRYYHYAYRTEQSYSSWILQYIKFYGGKTDPKDMGKNEVDRFLSHLAEKKNVAAATQKQALNALIFLYKKVLDVDLGDGIAPTRSKRRMNLPTVLTQEEVSRLLGKMKGKHALMAKLLYGGGLRLLECVRLRVKDVDFGQGRIFIRNPKGGKDRTVILPDSIQHELQEQMDYVIALHKEDILEGFGEVYIPGALSRKYSNLSKETGWQYVFPAKKLSKDPRSGKIMRHNVRESGLQKAVKQGLNRAKIYKKASCHTFRHYVESDIMGSVV